MLFHDGQVNGVAGGNLPAPQDNFFRALCDSTINSQDLIDDAEQGVERRLDGVATVDGDVGCRISCSTSASVTRRWRSLTSFSSSRCVSLL